MIYVLESESINIYLHIVYNCMMLFLCWGMAGIWALEEWTHAPYHPGNIKSLLQTKTNLQIPMTNKIVGPNSTNLKKNCQ